MDVDLPCMEYCIAFGNQPIPVFIGEMARHTLVDGHKLLSKLYCTE